MAASTTRPTADATALQIAVAASGGRDSTALLHCTARRARELGARVHALHVHHGLLPQADAWQRQLGAQCRRWAAAGLPVTLHVQRLHGAPAAGDSVEAWARRERYAALAVLARAADCHAVLLAHHRRDQAETVLLQLLRGAGARGLAAMPAQASRDGILWLRPWLDQPRAAIEAYLARHRLRWVDDASNAEPHLARNRLRLQVWPRLEAAFPHTEAALATAAARAAEEAACLRELAALDAAACVDGDALALDAWRALSEARRANLLRHQLEAWCGRGVPQTLMQRLVHELADRQPGVPVGRWPAPGGELRLYRDRLGFVRTAPATLAAAGANEAAPGAAARGQPLDLRRPGQHALPGWDGRLVVRAVRQGGVAMDRLAGVDLAAGRAGMRFQLRPGATPRSLKKQFQAAGIPAWARDGPVLLDAAGALLFVAGLGTDARCLAPDGVPQRALRWEAHAAAAGPGSDTPGAALPAA